MSRCLPSNPFSLYSLILSLLYLGNYASPFDQSHINKCCITQNLGTFSLFQYLFKTLAYTNTTSVSLNFHSAEISFSLVLSQQLANIAIKGSNERRYFIGVEGDKDRKGELFGLENLFSYRAEGASLAKDIAKRIQKLEAGYRVIKYEIVHKKK